MEYAVQVNTGFTKYKGDTVVKNTTMVNFSSDNSENYTSEPYGDSFTLSGGLFVQAQRVTNNYVILGLQLGVESLRSRTKVYEVRLYESPKNRSGSSSMATGKTILINKSINLHPYIGYRKSAGAVDLDFSVGTDIGYILELREKGKASAEDGNLYTSDKERNESEVVLDIRPRASFTAYRNKVGLSVSYAHGLSSYLSWYKGADLGTYTRVVRLGLVYRI